MGGTVSDILGGVGDVAKDVLGSDIGKIGLLTAPLWAGPAAGALGFGGNAAEMAGYDALMGGAASGGGAAGSLMPAAILPADPTFGGALSQTAPGVFENVGNAAAFGALNPGSAEALGLFRPGGLPAFSPGGGASAAPATPAAPAAPSVPATAPAGGGGLPAAGAATPGAAAGAGAAGAGGSFVDSLIKQMKDNALALGLIGGSTLLSAGQRPQIPNQQQLQGLGTDAANAARQLIGQYQSGQLAPGQQASLDQLAQNTKNQLRQYFASIGQSDSTAAVQSMAQVDQSVLAMKQQMLDSALQQGLQAVGVAQGPLNTIAQYQLGQDQQLKQAFGNFATGVGTLFGRGAGTQQPTAPTSDTASPTVTSVQP